MGITTNEVDLTGHVIGQYQLLERLPRQGAMGVVYRAYDRQLDRPVAVKLLSLGENNRNEALRRRFEREIKAITRFNHTHILSVHAAGVDQGTGLPYVVMTWAEGGSLDATFEEHPLPWPVARVLMLIRQICSALAEAHGKGIIHRDLKPGNILLDNAGNYQLGDFGLAKFQTGPDPGLTSSGATPGTPAYMAPEQMSGDEVTPATDIYALGLIAFQLLTKHDPHEGGRFPNLHLNRLYELPADPRRWVPGLPAPICEVVLRALQPAPSNRYADARIFSEDFANACNGLAPSQPSPPASNPAAFFDDVVQSAAEHLAPPLSPAGARAPTLGQQTASSSRIRVPPKPTPPRTQDHFFGQAVELETVAHQLATKRFVYISGLPGSGKTELAYRAACLSKAEIIIEHDFRPGENFRPLVEQVAKALFYSGRVELWDLLNAGLRPTDTGFSDSLVLDYMFDGLYGRGVVLVVNNFHHLADDPQLESFLSRVIHHCQAGALRVLITSQQLPGRLAEAYCMTLSGFKLEEFRQWPPQVSLGLPPSLVEDLHRLCGGNPHLLITVMQLLRAKDPSTHGSFIRHLMQQDEVTRHIADAVHKQLTPDEWEVVQVLALLGEHPGARIMIEACLGGRNLGAVFRQLRARLLIEPHDQGVDRFYSLNNPLREFAYNELATSARRALHYRVAEYYSRPDPNEGPVEPEGKRRYLAGWHYRRAGRTTDAIAQATGGVQTVINQGQGGGLLGLLIELQSEAGLTLFQQAQLQLATGQIQVVLGRKTEALHSLEAAITLAREQGEDTALTQIIAVACRSLAEALQEDDPATALTWIEEGLATLKDADPTEAATLRIRRGRILAHQGDAKAAERELRTGLTALPPKASRARFTALVNLGNLYCRRGDTQTGQEFYRQAVDNAQQMRDRWAEIEMRLNWGIEMANNGDWPGAQASYEQAQREAEALGSVAQQTRAWLMLGNLQVKQARMDEAVDSLSHSLRLARQAESGSDVAFALVSLANAHAEAERWEPVPILAAEAEPLAMRSNSRDVLPELYRALALRASAIGEPATAISQAERALSAAREIDDRREIGLSQRVLGQALAAAGQAAEAEAQLRASLEALTTIDAYEFARTQLTLAAMALQRRERPSEAELAASHALLCEAEAVFRRLGAAREVARVMAIER